MVRDLPPWVTTTLMVGDGTGLGRAVDWTHRSSLDGCKESVGLGDRGHARTTWMVERLSVFEVEGFGDEGLDEEGFGFERCRALG